jgi:hypothetical protein
MVDIFISAIVDDVTNFRILGLRFMNNVDAYEGTFMVDGLMFIRYRKFLGIITVYLSRSG